MTGLGRDSEATAAGLAASHPAVCLAAAMGMALIGTHYRQSLRAAQIALALVSVVWFIGEIADASVAVAETQILAAGAIIGEPAPRPRRRSATRRVAVRE